MEEKKLESMISNDAYEEIESKVKEKVGEDAFKYIFPAVKKAIEEGDGAVRKNILIDWLDMCSCRVCSHCGEIMEEGWYLGYHGYACSDECCCEIMNITKEEYNRYQIYLEDIKEYLKDEGKGRKPEELTEEEIKEITSEIVDGRDEYYYTEWY